MDLHTFLQLVLLAMILESLVQTLKPIWRPEERTVIFYVNLAVGLSLSTAINYLAGLDLFAAVGVPLVRLPVVGVILTGILLSRGANFMHDLIKAMQHFQQILEPLQAVADPEPEKKGE